jgi:urea transporter
VCRNSAEVTSSGTEFERANSRVQVKVMTTSTMAPNTGHEPANDNGGVRSGRETAHTSSIQQELDCESLCALLGSVLAMVLVPVQLMLELSCVLSVVFYLWSFFVTRVLTKAEEGGCRLDRKTLLHVFLCAAGAGAAAALGGVMIGVVAAMLVMYITSPLVAGLFGWCLGEYLRTCRYSATGWPILQVDFISNH